MQSRNSDSNIPRREQIGQRVIGAVGGILFFLVAVHLIAQNSQPATAARKWWEALDRYDRTELAMLTCRQNHPDVRRVLNAAIGLAEKTGETRLDLAATMARILSVDKLDTWLIERGGEPDAPIARVGVQGRLLSEDGDLTTSISLIESMRMVQEDERWVVCDADLADVIEQKLFVLARPSVDAPAGAPAAEEALHAVSADATQPLPAAVAVSAAPGARTPAGLPFLASRFAQVKESETPLQEADFAVLGSALLSPDGKWLAAGQGANSAGVVVWSLPDGRLALHRSDITGGSFIFTPDSNHLLVHRAAEGELLALEMATGQGVTDEKLNELQQWDPLWPDNLAGLVQKRKSQYTEHSVGSGYPALISANSRRLAATGDGLPVMFWSIGWDGQDGEPKGEFTWPVGRAGFPTSHFSADGFYFIEQQNGRPVRLWSVETGGLLRNMAEQVVAVDVGAEGRMALLLDREEGAQISVESLNTGEPAAWWPLDFVPGPDTRLYLHPSQDLLLIHDRGAGQLYFLSWNTGLRYGELPSRAEQHFFVGGGDYLVAVGAEPRPRRWDLRGLAGQQ